MSASRAVTAALLAAMVAMLATTTSFFAGARAEDDNTGVRERPKLVTERTDAAIERGCAWLARHQASSGNEEYPVAMRALSGMAFLAHGDTATRGKYARNVRRTIDWLLRCSRRGLITAPGEGRPIYGHGFAMMFLAECLAEDEEPIKKTLHAAIDVTVKAQSADGGWNYAPGDAGDEGSTTITQVQALRACRNAGLEVPKKTIDAAVRYIARSQCPDGGIAYRAQDAGSGQSRPAITAAAVAVLYDAGRYDSEIAKKALRYLNGKTFDGHFFYGHLYMTQARWQEGGEAWAGYYPKIRDALLARQQSDGSWHGDDVGQVYGTAVAVTILALPYEHVPIYSR